MFTPNNSIVVIFEHNTFTNSLYTDANESLGAALHVYTFTKHN